MLNENELQLIDLFIDNQLHNKNVDHFYIQSINLILEKIQSYQNFCTLTKIQIFQKLILETSYNSPLLSTNLLSRYYNYVENILLKYPFYIWQTLINLSIHAFRNIKFSRFDLHYSAINFFYDLVHLTDIVQAERRGKIFKKKKIPNIHILKYAIFKKDEEDSYNPEYRLKQAIVIIHKIFNKMPKFARIKPFSLCIIYILYYDYLLSDFNLSKKDLQLYINILIDIAIKSMLAFKKEPNHIFKDSCNCPWNVIVDLIFTNWNLLWNKHKAYLKKHGKEFINFCFEHDVIYNKPNNKLQRTALILLEKFSK